MFKDVEGWDIGGVNSAASIFSDDVQHLQHRGPQSAVTKTQSEKWEISEILKNESMTH